MNVSKGTAIINYTRVEYVGGDNILKVRHILDASVAVLHFGDNTRVECKGAAIVNYPAWVEDVWRQGSSRLNKGSRQSSKEHSQILLK
jgi:hypothetical protein